MSCIAFAYGCSQGYPRSQEASFQANTPVDPHLRLQTTDAVSISLNFLRDGALPSFDRTYFSLDGRFKTRVDSLEFLSF